MTWLPMLFVGRGNQKELKPKPDPAQDVQPRFEKVCARPARPKPAEGTKQSNEHKPGPQRRPRPPHRERSGNEL